MAEAMVAMMALDPRDAEKIARLALRVERQRQVVDEAKKRRAVFVCERSCPSDEDWQAGPNRGTECWRRNEWRWYPHEYEPREPEKWCQSCRERQLAHQQCVREARKLGALRGALTRACRRVLAEEKPKP